MSRGKVFPETILALEHILLEYTDENHPMEIRELSEKLYEIYGIEAERDHIQWLLDILSNDKAKIEKKRYIPPEELTDENGDPIKDKHGNPLVVDYRRKDFLHEGNEDYYALKTHCIVQKKSKTANASNSKKSYWAGGRWFDDLEVQLLVDAVNSLRFLRSGDSKELISKIQSLQSRNCRTDPHYRVGTKDSIKPSWENFYGTLMSLEEAIDDKKSISFNYTRYDTEQKTGITHERKPIRKIKKGRRDNSVENCSPYRIHFTDSHYYLLGWVRGEFKVYRTDLMEDIVIDENNGKNYYRELNDKEQKLVDTYFDAGIIGVGGEAKHIVLRCNEYAYHYIYEQFSDFEGFKVKDLPESSKDGWDYEVQFQAAPLVVEFYCPRWLAEVEVIEPKRVRENIMERIKANAYGIKFEEAAEADSKSSPKSGSKSGKKSASSAE